MKLESIEIRNFKGLRQARLDSTMFSCLVGENNSGKSTVLQAIHYVLTRPSQIPLPTYHDPSMPVSFTAVFSAVTADHLARLSEDHRNRIAPLVAADRFSLIVRYNLEGKVELRIPAQIPNDPRYRRDAIDNAFRGARGRQVSEILNAQYQEFAEGFDAGQNATAAKEWIQEKIAALPPDQFTLGDEPLPTGAPASISALLPEAIYIPAVKDIADDLKTNQSTPFGRLLSLLLDDMTPDLEAISASLDNLKRLLNRVVENGEMRDVRHDKVKEMEALVESFLGQNFPSAKVQMEIPPPELKTILSAAQIYIDDGSRELIDNKGDGIKRSLTFAIFRAYVEQLSKKRPVELAAQEALRPLIFLFEEPELYLHPKAQRVLFNTLAKISQTHQVLVTTHSPLFFSPGVTAGFVRIAKRPGEPKPYGELHPVTFSLDAASAEAFRLARFENADAAFFCTKVVLVEGESDDAYFKHVAQKLNPDWDFDARNFALVRVSGKGNFAKFRAFFKHFGIEVLIVADLDALFEGYENLGASAGVSDIRTRAIVAIDQRIQAEGIRAEPRADKIKDRVTFKQRYEPAKAALRELQETQKITPEIIQRLDALFTWEPDVGRAKAAREDGLSALAIVPVLDALRQEGIFILSKGTIEDYYPQNTPGGAKPQRALAAADLVATQEIAKTLSAPLDAGRSTELEQIYEKIFE